MWSDYSIRSKSRSWRQDLAFRKMVELGEMEMDRISVRSSNIVSVGYDSVSETLEIEFDNGVYQYSGVPEAIHSGLMSASSAGRYFHINIKDKYAGVKVM